MIISKGFSLGYGYAEGRVVSLNSGQQRAFVDMKKPIIIGKTFSPAFLVEISSSHNVQGIITQQGGQFSHLAVLSNSMQIPYVIVNDLSPFVDGELIGIDCFRGTIFKLSDHQNKQRFRELKERWINYQEQVYRRRNIPCITRKGQHIKILADITTKEQLREAVECGADGLGIVRTEFLSLNRTTPPSLDELLKYFQSILQICPWRPIPIRLYDLGGDKIPTWMRKLDETEKSPIGLRGIRLKHLLSEEFSNFFKALALVSQEGSVQIFIPMVTDIKEIESVKKELETLARGFQIKPNVELGLIVETPNCALTVEKFLPLVNSVQIGPGDLTQFTLAYDRRLISPALVMPDCFLRSVLKIIRRIVVQCQRYKKPFFVCVDLRPSKSLMRSLIHIGVKTISVPPWSVPFWKEIVRSI